MGKRLCKLAWMLAVVLCLMTVRQPAASADSWYWLGSDAKYGKFFDPASVVVMKRAKTEHGLVATEIEAWTKTTYSYAGAAETIETYGIKNLLPNPIKLAYSMAHVRINPQNRTIQYLKEDFYDAGGKVTWSKGEGRVKEINSREFDEPFYAAVVDEVFRQGEMARCLAKDRWITLWQNTSNGISTSVQADTTTMRLRGENLILWEWEESRNASGAVLEVKFMKKFVNLPNGTERLESGQYWSQKTGWKILEDDMDGAYRAISEKSPEHKGLERLRAFAKGYSTWVNRYRLN